MSRKDHGQSFIYGHENDAHQRSRWVRGRAIFRQLQQDRRDAIMNKLYGSAFTRPGLFGRLYAFILRIVASMSPVTRRLQREQKVAQELRHSRRAYNLTKPQPHQRRSFNRKAS